MSAPRPALRTAAGITIAAVFAASVFFLYSLSGAITVEKLSSDWTNSLSVQRYFRHVYYLASDALKGRGNGTPELQTASEYIANQFRMFGLKPAGDKDTYFQDFQITTLEYGNNSDLELDGEKLQIDEDYEPLSFSESDKVQGPVVFAGYGITAPSLQWDDYQGLNVTGKIVLVFRHEPQELDPKSRFDGTDMTTHSTFMNKAINARQHGAIGILFITDPNNHPDDTDAMTPQIREAGSDDAGIVAMRMTRARASRLFEKIGKNVSEVQKQMDSLLKPQSFDLAAKGRLVADLPRVHKSIHNVIAAIPGSDPGLRNEWVVIGAHYDHLGLGDEHSLDPNPIGKIHHGADDNASGTAGVLELARLASMHPHAFKRSLLFMTFAGEELGLLGSSYFVNHPTVPLGSITSMINMDMIGRVRNQKLSVLGVGTSPDFKSWIQEFDKTVGLEISYSSGGHDGSDHISFNAKHIPIMFFFSNLHGEYHRPTDTSDKINSQGAIQVLTLVAKSVERLAKSPERPIYTEVRDQQPSSASASSGSGYKVYFGSVPNFGSEVKGVLFDDVHADSPAGKAGLKGGDILVEFGGKSIQNLEDFTFALNTSKVGDVVSVVVQRNGQPLKVNVTLKARQ